MLLAGGKKFTDAWGFKVVSCKRTSLKSTRFSGGGVKVGYFSSRGVLILKYKHRTDISIKFRIMAGACNAMHRGNGWLLCVCWTRWGGGSSGNRRASEFHMPNLCCVIARGSRCSVLQQLTLITFVRFIFKASQTILTKIQRRQGYWLNN